MSTINLLPDDYIRKRWQNRANVLCVALFIVVMAGVGMASLVSENNSRHTREVLDRVNASYSEAAKLLAQMRQLEATKRAMLAKAKATGSLLEKIPRSYLLALVTRSLPKNASLTKVELKPGNARSVRRQRRRRSKFNAVKGKSKKGAPVEKPPPPPMIMEATGLAATDVQVAVFIANLNRSPLWTSVDLDYSQDKILNAHKKDMSNLRVREFKVTMELRPNVDVIDLVGGKSASGTPTASAESTTGGTQS